MPVTTFATSGIIAEVPNAVPAVPIVYLHGWGRSRHDFAAIAGQRPGMAVDLPGFGSSAEPLVAMGSVGYADQVLEAIAQWAGSASFIVVGHSFGGRIALQIAATAGDSVRGLIVSGTPLFRNQSQRKPPLTYRTTRAFHKFGLVSDARLESARRKYGSVDYLASTGVMRDTFVKIVNESYESTLSEIRCPTAFVWGRHDSAAPLEDTRKAHRIVEGSILEERDCGHDVHLHHPELFVELIDNFAERS